jgi:hypothetical protein
MKLRRPDTSHRVCITGRTGSGKSQFAMALLSQARWDKMPYVFIDYKGEPLFLEMMDENPGMVKTLKVTDKAPKKPGLYYMQPIPNVDDEAIDVFLWSCYHKGNIGIVVDEGYSLPQTRKNCFDALLTQGRTKNIPIIVLYQRPAWMSRFAVAQADFHAYFEQSDERDCITARAFIKPYIDKQKGITITTLSPLPKYHCLWHDVGEGKTALLLPAPSRDAILETFRLRLNAKPLKEKVLV